MTRGAVLDATVECLTSWATPRPPPPRSRGAPASPAAPSCTTSPPRPSSSRPPSSTCSGGASRSFARPFRPSRARRPPTAAIDLLWPMFSGPTFVAWLELVVAARTDRARHRFRAGRLFGETVETTFASSSATVPSIRSPTSRRRSPSRCSKASRSSGSASEASHRRPPSRHAQDLAGVTLGATHPLRRRRSDRNAATDTSFPRRSVATAAREVLRAAGRPAERTSRS